jgi:hypothetical protein
MAYLVVTNSHALPQSAEVSFGLLTPFHDYLDVWVDPAGQLNSKLLVKVYATLGAGGVRTVIANVVTAFSGPARIAFSRDTLGTVVPIGIDPGTTYEVTLTSLDATLLAAVKATIVAYDLATNDVPETDPGVPAALVFNAEVPFATLNLFHTKLAAALAPLASSNSGAQWRVYGSNGPGSVRALVFQKNFSGKTISNTPLFEPEEIGLVGAEKFELVAFGTDPAASGLLQASLIGADPVVDSGGGGAAFVPAGTGFFHATAGVEDPLAKLVNPADTRGLGPTFVFRPGGVAAVNVFTTWASLMAALLVVQGPKVLQFDDSIVTPIIIPAGAYDLDSSTLSGNSSAAHPTGFTDVEFADGVIFTNFSRYITGNLRLRTLATTTAPVTLTPALGGIGIQLVVDGESALTTGVPATKPFFEVTGGAFFDVQVINGFVAAFAAQPVFHADAVSTFAITLGYEALLNNNTIAGAVGSAIFINVNDQETFAIGTPNPIVQAGCLSGFTLAQNALPTGTGFVHVTNGYLDPAAVPGVTTETTFVFKPGGVAAGNVYVTWAALMTAFSSFVGPKAIQFDDSIVTPAVVPAGVYDMTDTVLLGTKTKAGGVNVQVHLNDGVVFTHLNDVQDNVTLKAFGTVLPVVTMTAGQVFSLGNGAQILNDPLGVVPFFSVPVVPQVPLLRLQDSEQWAGGGQLGDGVTATVHLVAAAGLLIALGPHAALATNTVTGAAGSSLSVQVQSQGALSTFGGDTVAPITQVGVPTVVVQQDGLPTGTGFPHVTNGYLDPAAVSGVTTETTFVFHPGGVAGGNVYTTWASLYAAFSSFVGPKIIEYNTDDAAAVIPAGTYDFKDTTHTGRLSRGSITIVSLPDGVILQNLETVTNFMRFNSHATTVSPVTLAGAAIQEVSVQNRAQLASDGAATLPFFNVTGGSFLDVELGFDSFLFSFGAQGTTAVDGTSIVNIHLGDVAGLSNNTITGAPGCLVAIFIESESAQNATYGNTPNPIVQGGVPAASLSIIYHTDDIFEVQNVADLSKKFKVDLSGLTTGNTLAMFGNTTGIPGFTALANDGPLAASATGLLGRAPQFKVVSVNFAASPFAVDPTVALNLLVDVSGGAVVVTLPAVGFVAGDRVSIKNLIGAAAVSNITVTPGGGQLIESTTVPQAFGATSAIAITGANFDYEYTGVAGREWAIV